MEFRQALAAIADRLKPLRVSVIPHPPRQLPTTRSVFFGAIQKSRVSQDGGNELVLTLIVTTSSQTDGQFDELEELTDRIDTIIDANDIDGVDLTIEAGNEWSMGEIDVAGTTYFGARADVTVHY